jgi:histidine phosphotransferase ChpT
MESSLTLCQLLSSHLCHEVSGPISAINNSIDLMNSSEPEIKNNAKELVVYANKQLVHKIKFYSYIYSLSSNTEESVSLSYIQDLCLGFFDNTNVAVDFNSTLASSLLNRDLSKVLMCLVTTAHKNLSKEGLIQVICQDYNIISIKATGEKLYYNQEAIDVLTSYKDAIPTIFNCNEYYAALLNERIGYKLSVKTYNNNIEYNLYKY